MSSYNAVDGQALTATTTAQKVTRSTSPNIKGYRLKQIGAGAVYVKEIRNGDTAPDFASMVTAGKTSWPVLAPGDVVQSGAIENVDVYYCCDSGTVACWFEDVR